MPKSIVILSGGMDSAVLLYHLLREGHDVRALSFNYGQRHKKELKYARKLCHSFPVPVPHATVQLAPLAAILPGSSQTDKAVAVPEGHYSEETMKQTVVPNRNMIMISIAVGHALAHQCDFVAFGAHGGDHAIYPDCRSEFVQMVNEAVKVCDWNVVEVIAPFLRERKEHVVRRGKELGVDFAQTWSCYKGGRFHCGRCGTCIERREAFFLAGIGDPTRYESTAPSVAQLVAADWKVRRL